MYAAPTGTATPGAPVASPGAPVAPSRPVGNVTIASAHDMVIAVGIEVGFVIAMVIVAGFSPKVGKAIIVIMLVLLAYQGIRNSNPITNLLIKHPLVPTSNTGG